MRYHVLACDYDGTIAHHGQVSAATLGALEKVRQSGRKLIMVTGREIDDLRRVFPQLDVFDWVVGENGALIYNPATGEEKLLAEPPTSEFAERLIAKGVERLSVGRVVVATWEPYEKVALDVIRDMGLDLQIILNKGAVMILPTGVNKAFGLEHLLAELNLSPHNTVGIGDAENDESFLLMCEVGVAVANALDSLKQRVDLVLKGINGDGVQELIQMLLASDLSFLDDRRHYRSRS